MSCEPKIPSSTGESGSIGIASAITSTDFGDGVAPSDSSASSGLGKFSSAGAWGAREYLTGRDFERLSLIDVAFLRPNIDLWPSSRSGRCALFGPLRYSGKGLKKPCLADKFARAQTLKRQKDKALNADPELNLDDIRAGLEAEKTALEAVDAASSDGRRTVELDQQSVGRLSRMDALQGQAMAKAVGLKRQARLKRIDAALRRIAEDDYGYCRDCGEDIPAARLAIDPAIERCIGCAS